MAFAFFCLLAAFIVVCFGFASFAADASAASLRDEAMRLLGRPDVYTLIVRPPSTMQFTDHPRNSQSGNMRRTLRIVDLSGSTLILDDRVDATFDDGEPPVRYADIETVDLSAIDVTPLKDVGGGRLFFSLSCRGNVNCVQVASSDAEIGNRRSETGNIGIALPNRVATRLRALLVEAGAGDSRGAQASAASASNAAAPDNSAAEAVAETQQCQSNCRSKEADCRSQPDICEPEPTDVLCETPAQISAQKVAQYADCSREKSVCMNDCAQGAEASHIPAVVEQAQQAAQQQQQVSNAAQSQSQAAQAAVAPPSTGQAIMQGLAQGLQGVQAMQSPPPLPRPVPPVEPRVASAEPQPRNGYIPAPASTQPIAAPTVGRVTPSPPSQGPGVGCPAQGACTLGGTAGNGSSNGANPGGGTVVASNPSTGGLSPPNPANYREGLTGCVSTTMQPNGGTYNLTLVNNCGQSVYVYTSDAGSGTLGVGQTGRMIASPSPPFQMAVCPSGFYPFGPSNLPWVPGQQFRCWNGLR